MTELDEIRAILRDVATRQQAISEQQEITQRQLEITRSIADSNARAIEAWRQQLTESQEELEEENSVLSVRLGRHHRSLILLISESRENIRQHEEFRSRFARLEGNGNGDRSND